MPEGYTLLTYMFLHGDILHLLSNMLFLWVFGDNVEDAMGHVRFLFFYLACGVFAGLFHCWMMPNSDLPTIGSSGAVAGVIAAYLMLHPRVSVWVLAFKFIPLRITAGLVLGLWIALQVVMIALGVGTIWLVGDLAHSPAARTQQLHDGAPVGVAERFERVPAQLRRAHVVTVT